VFKHIKGADLNGIHRQGTLICAPALLVKTFGRVEISYDDHKVTGEYEFAQMKESFLLSTTTNQHQNTTQNCHIQTTFGEATESIGLVWEVKKVMFYFF